MLDRADQGRYETHLGIFISAPCYKSDIIALPDKRHTIDIPIMRRMHNILSRHRDRSWPLAPITYYLWFCLGLDERSNGGEYRSARSERGDRPASRLRNAIKEFVARRRRGDARSSSSCSFARSDASIHTGACIVVSVRGVCYSRSERREIDPLKGCVLAAEYEALLCWGMDVGEREDVAWFAVWQDRVEWREGFGRPYTKVV
jgi:hypothetical protein